MIDLYLDCRYIKRVAYGASFDAMKAQAGDQSSGRKKGEAPVRCICFPLFLVKFVLIFRGLWTAQHIRKGGVGGWKEYFTVEQSEKFDRQWEREMAGCAWRPTYESA